MTTAIHQNSLAAFVGTRFQRATLQTRILGLMADGQARTDRQIQHDLNHSEKLNPRITDMVNEGLLHEVGSKTCQWTGLTVRLTKRFL